MKEEEVKETAQEETQNQNEGRIPTKEEYKRMQKEAAMQLADYKRRLRESVEMKRLQVEELELNIRYHHVRQEHKKLQVLIQEEEARERAELMQKQATEEKKRKLEVVKTGKPRTEEEIAKAKEEIQ